MGQSVATCRCWNDAGVSAVKFEMNILKKYLLSALASALFGDPMAGMAQSAPMDHSSNGMGMRGMMESDSPDMQGAADAQRQAAV